MSPRTWVCTFVMLLRILLTTAQTDPLDYAALYSLKQDWQDAPSTWIGNDPCGSKWEGIACNGSRVISIILPSMGLRGDLSSDIQGLDELQSLDLSYNRGLTGPLPDTIGKLSKLTNLVLVGCGFTGPIPDSVGSLSKLIFLSLNSNSFIGEIPASLGNLKNLYWLDLADNLLTGSIPVSSGTTPGLDLLHHTKHFHFGKNKLSGPVPSQLFSSNMTLIHVLLDSNNLTGKIPDTLGLVKELQVLRLDRNFFTGLPSNLNNLTKVNQMILSNNFFAGSLPNLTGMNLLTYVDMSNNSFDVSDVPSWFSSLPSLTTLILERTRIQGSLPAELFNLPQLQTVILRRNLLNGTLGIDSGYSKQLDLVDLQENSISTFSPTGDLNFQLILVDNPVCQESSVQSSYCTDSPESDTPYFTPPKSCDSPVCSASQVSSPNCACAYPYTGTMSFRAVTFSDLDNVTYFTTLEDSLINFFSSHRLPVDSVSLGNATVDSSYLKINLEMFPAAAPQFNRTGISVIGFALSNQTYKPPPIFGPYFFIASAYSAFEADGSDQSNDTNAKGLSSVVIIGIAVGGSVLFLLILLIAILIIIICLKRTRSDKQNEVPSRPVSAAWDSFKSNTSIPQVSGAKWFTLEEMKKCTDNFSEANVIGSGGYGKVYKGFLLDRRLVAVKRADSRSIQGGLEFKAEIELLSRVHHKNLVTLHGFCFEQGELMLVYEYISNGTLKQSLSGKSGVRLDWRRRAKVTLGAARGIQYLHELANPPIIHRDIKSNNILLDETLTAKVSDFGLSKAYIDGGKGHVTTQVKGTMGYLDPEYYMTQRLTEKSDVYSFGVLMLEILTGKAPIERGRYIVREVRNSLDKSQDLYNLHELLDPAIGLGSPLGGFEQFVDLALRCVQESGSSRPAMGEVVKELETIIEAAGLNPFSDSATSSAAFPDAGAHSPYPEYSLYAHTASVPR